MTDFSDGMEVLMLMVLLYFLLSLSIQLVVYMHLCTWAGKVHVREVGTVALGLVLSQGRVLAFPFLDKGNELSVSLEGFHLVVLQWKHLTELLSHCQFVFMGHAAKYLSLDVCHAELVCGTGKGCADGILYSLQRIGND